MSLIEQLTVVSLVGILASIPIVTGRSDRDQLQLDASARRLQIGLDRARGIAGREQRACVISLSEEGFMAPDEGILPASLPACTGIGMSLQEDFEQGPVVLNTNLPPLLRFTANGSDDYTLPMYGTATIFAAAARTTTEAATRSLPNAASVCNRCPSLASPPFS